MPHGAGNGQASTKYSNRVLFKSSSTFQNRKNRVPSEYRVNLNFSKSSTSTSTEQTGAWYSYSYIQLQLGLTVTVTVFWDRHFLVTVTVTVF